jgi:hypothetical protein
MIIERDLFPLRLKREQVAISRAQAKAGCIVVRKPRLEAASLSRLDSKALRLALTQGDGEKAPPLN